MFKKALLVSLVVVFMMTGCLGDKTSAVATKAPAQNPTATAAPVNPTATPVQPTATPASVNPTQAVVPAATDTPAATAVSINCSITDGTAEIQLMKISNDWGFDPGNIKVVAGYNNSLSGHDASNLSGCDFLSEFEDPSAQQHDIQILRDTPGEPFAFLDKDGKYHCPSSKGCSVYASPVGWNMDNWSTKKPSIALEFAANKRINQVRNGYNWPIQVTMPDGSTKVFGTDYTFGGFYSGCKDISVPEPVNVAGSIQSDGSFIASIGMEGCLTAVKMDGTWSFWRDAKDGVAYTDAQTIQAWLFPANTSEDDVKQWIDKQK